MMKYKNYIATIEYDPDANHFHGEILGMRDVVTFCGTSVKELEKEFRNSVDDYIEFCRKKGKTPERSFSGTLNLRMPPTLHKEVALQAEAKQKSINEWINEAIGEKLKQSS